MNDNHSRAEQEYLPRWLADPLREALDTYPIVVLSGARQVGKSTLLANEKPFSEWPYVTMDDFDALERAQTDPASLWAGESAVVLDEVQKAPGVLDAIKSAVDRDHNMRFALSGSANLLLMRHVSESLAGRAAYFELGPMTLGEIERKSADDRLSDLLDGRFPPNRRVQQLDPLPFMARGMVPRLLDADDRVAATWWEGYTATYLERDLRQLSQVESLPDFRRVMEALALRQGRLLNKSEVGRDARVTQPTTHRYISLLEASSLVRLVTPYGTNRTKRLVKAPRAFWFDSGLASYLSGHYSTDSLRSSREAGAAMECLVFTHLSVMARLLAPKARVFYWRTVSGDEVDFVVEHGRRVTAFEVKLADSVGLADTRGLERFMRDHPACKCGVAVYSGSQIKRLSDSVVALPWSVLAGADGWS